MEIRWLIRARRAREAAIDYIRQENPLAALRMMDEVEDQTDNLSEYPERGRPGRINGTRELVINRTPFIAIYRIKIDIEIINFLHGAQRWPKK